MQCTNTETLLVALLMLKSKSLSDMYRTTFFYKLDDKYSVEYTYAVKHCTSPKRTNIWKQLEHKFNKSEIMPKAGDLVVTSGSAQVFPSDILVGKIVKITKNNFFVLPFVDFKNIDYVQVVETK